MEADVVGGCIGGLTAAMTLRQAGAEVAQLALPEAAPMRPGADMVRTGMRLTGFKKPRSRVRATSVDAATGRRRAPSWSRMTPLRGATTYCKFLSVRSRFMVITTGSFDQADPSIFTVLGSSCATRRPNLEIAIFPPRSLGAHDTFRPPWLHREVMSETMGLVRNRYEVLGAGPRAGALAIHNCMMAHGPDAGFWQAVSERELRSEYPDVRLVFVPRSPGPFVPTPFALYSAARDQHYDAVWNGCAPAGGGKA